MGVGGSTHSVSSTSLKREIIGIALLLFAVFLAGAFVALALAELRTGVSVEASVGPVGQFLSQPLVSFFGWPAAILIPLVPAVHALRLFGRLESSTDRSWMIFFAGLVLLLPVALALSLASPRRASPAPGIWGEADRGVVAELVRRVRRVGARRPLGLRAHGDDAGVESDPRAHRPPAAGVAAVGDRRGGRQAATQARQEGSRGDRRRSRARARAVARRDAGDRSDAPGRRFDRRRRRHAQQRRAEAPEEANEGRGRGGPRRRDRGGDRRDGAASSWAATSCRRPSC